MYKLKNVIIMISIIFITFLSANQENVIQKNVSQENPTLKNITEENTTQENKIDAVQENKIDVVQENTTLKDKTTKVIVENNTTDKKEIAKKDIQTNEYDPNDILIGFYGRPYAKSLGILGELNIDDLTKKMKLVKKEYEAVSNGVKIVPTYHIIKDVATLESGNDLDHIKPLNELLIMKYINRAQKENFAVILDVQLGTMTPIEAVRPILKFLKYPNVHIAIDPEFKIPKHRKFPPGKFIGHIFAKDVNEVQEAMQNYMIENHIKGKRMLLIHMFYERMLRNKSLVKKYDRINLTYNIDGHGKASTKIKIYNSLYNKAANKVAQGGFKIFYKNDKKPLMTPKQILGLEPVKGRMMWTKPNYINYH
jgi:hypothetical protein